MTLISINNICSIYWTRKCAAEITLLSVYTRTHWRSRARASGGGGWLKWNNERYVLDWSFSSNKHNMRTAGARCTRAMKETWSVNDWLSSAIEICDERRYIHTERERGAYNKAWKLYGKLWYIWEELTSSCNQPSVATRAEIAQPELCTLYAFLCLLNIYIYM